MKKDLSVIKAIIKADYERHIQRFNFDKQIGDVLLLGDSIIAYLPFKAYQLTHWINQGIPGDTTDGVIRRLDLAFSVKPKIVLIHIGSNDFVLTDNSEDQIIHNIQLIISFFESHDINTYLLSVTPILTNHIKTNTTYTDQRTNDKINHLNKRLKAITNNYIDVNGVLKDDQDQLNPSYTKDGVHLNDEGYQIFIKKVKTFID